MQLAPLSKSLDKGPSGQTLVAATHCCQKKSANAVQTPSQDLFLTSTVTGIYFSVGKSINLITNFGVGKTKLIMNKWIIDGFLGKVNKQMFSKPKLLVQVKKVMIYCGRFFKPKKWLDGVYVNNLPILIFFRIKCIKIKSYFFKFGIVDARVC